MYVLTQKGYRTKEIKDCALIPGFLRARGVNFPRFNAIKEIASNMEPGDEIIFNFGLKISCF